MAALTMFVDTPTRVPAVRHINIPIQLLPQNIPIQLLPQNIPIQLLPTKNSHTKYQPSHTIITHKKIPLTLLPQKIPDHYYPLQIPIQLLFTKNFPYNYYPPKILQKAPVGYVVFQMQLCSMW